MRRSYQSNVFLKLPHFRVCANQKYFLTWLHSKWTYNIKYCCLITSLSPLQICDKEWHYYVINVEFPAVTLFVDGVTYEPYLVTDDWPIHTSKIDTQLTVGACWQGQYVYLKICSSFKAQMQISLKVWCHCDLVRCIKCFFDAFVFELYCAFYIK